MKNESKSKVKKSKFGQCPFCDEKEKVTFNEGWSSGKPHRYWYVSCYSCGASGPEKRRKKDALKAWKNGCRVKEKITMSLWVRLAFAAIKKRVDHEEHEGR